MFNAEKPDPSQLPSTGRLLKSTGIAAVIASALLVTVVLPAEYGIDPTGAGSVLGLTEMGRIKMSLAKEAEAESAGAATSATPAVPPATDPPADTQTPAVVQEPSTASSTPAAEPKAPETSAQANAFQDETTITLAPDEGYEIKLVMEKGAKAKFLWFTDGPGVNYDTHADGEGVKYHGYGKGTDEDRLEGDLVAAFTGQHGWFWRNRSGQDVKITLKTSGDYSDIKIIE